MAKRTYEQKLLDDLRTLPHTTWYMCKPEPEFMPALTSLMDKGHPYELSNDHKRLRRICTEQEMPPPYHQMKQLPEGLRMEVIEAGTVETFTVFIQKPKGNHTFTHVFEKKCYRIWRGDVLVATE